MPEAGGANPGCRSLAAVYIDMHVHSKQSDDAGGTVEGYLKWINVIRRKGYQVDGIVLTEHRGFDFEIDYSDLAEQYGVRGDEGGGD